MEIHYSIWFSIIPTLFAIAAAVYAVRVSRAAQRAVSAPPPIVTDRRASITATTLDGRARRDLTTDAREYAFLVAIENASGAETTITDVELRVSYRTRANFCGAVDVPTDIEAQIDAETPARPRLHVPLRLGARQAASGWVEFRTANIIPRHCRVDGYLLIVTDAGGVRVSTDASLPMVLAADTDGRGPATWGWD